MSEGNSWDQVYLDYYEKGSKLAFGDKPDNFVIWLSNFLKGQGQVGATVLGSGCGEGRNSIYMARQGFRMYGVDVASKAIETGKRWVQSEGLVETVKLSVGDVTSLPCEDEFFDAIIDIFTMEFVPERAEYIKEAARVLKDNGLFFIRTHKPPAKHSLSVECLKKLLGRDFRILQVDSPSEDTLNLVAKRKIRQS